MFISKLELTNFRLYKGTNVIDFDELLGRNVYIISGKNGFGKTSFLMSLVWCLYGRQMHEVDELYHKEISEQGGYQKYISSSLNRESKREGEEEFSVEITLTNFDEIIPEFKIENLTIRRSYNIRTGEKLIILIDGFENGLIGDLGNDKYSGEEIFIRDFLLPIEIAKFFFFDAEKIVSLAEVNTLDQRRKLSKAYSEILGIKKYEDLKKEYEDTKTRVRSRFASKEDRASLESINNEIQEVNSKIDKNVETIQHLENKCILLKSESDEIQRKLIRMGDSISVEDLSHLKTIESNLSQKLKDLQKDLLDYFEIIPFAIAYKQLNEVVNQIECEQEAKLLRKGDENLKIASEQIIKDLKKVKKQAEDKDEIIFDYYQRTIEELIKKYLLNEKSDTKLDQTKILHDFSDVEVREIMALEGNLKNSFIISFRNISNKNNSIRNELNQIRRKITEAEKVADDIVVREYRDKKQIINNEELEITQNINVLKIENEILLRSINQKQKQSSEITKNLTVSDKKQGIDELTSSLSNSLMKYIVLFKDRKKKSLEKQILESLKVLMHKQNFIGSVNVNIKDDDISIHLLDLNGDEIQKESLSKGEQQMYATALLQGLVKGSEIQFPVFIDSPMQKFDEKHAENIIKYFYPNISKQVIIFPLINKELTIKEYTMLINSVASTYLIINKDSNQSKIIKVQPENLFEDIESFV